MQKRSQPNHTATKKPPERNDPKAMLSVLSLVQAIRLDLGKAPGTPLAALLVVAPLLRHSKQTKAATTRTI